MSCPLEKFARVVGKCPVCLAEHEAGPSSLPGLIADWAEDDRPAPPDGVVSLAVCSCDCPRHRAR